jgi:prevent-host-death family protein
MKGSNTRVAAAEANRRFSSLLRLVKQGRTFVVTSHGRPVAKIVPVGAEGAGAGRARAALLARLREQPVQRIGRWTRDELYER